jgi:hypothetical protein
MNGAGKAMFARTPDRKERKKLRTFKRDMVGLLEVLQYARC